MRLKVPRLPRVRRRLGRVLGALLVVALAGGATAYALTRDDGDGPGRRAATAPKQAARLAPDASLPPEATLPAETAVPAKASRHRRRRAAHNGASYYKRTTTRHVSASTETSFLPLYRVAARTFDVNWRLIASIHRQETAFSTEPGTYHGVNAFGCCAGPMQFNIKNGPLTTWKRYRDSFRQAKRLRAYPHRTSFHPSVYDDFDSILAAAALLRDDGAGPSLVGPGAWSAAYGYYGHDNFGVTYANQVVARAKGWARTGFCANCGLDESIVAAEDATYGASARRVLAEDAAKHHKHHHKKKKKKKKKKKHKPATRHGSSGSSSASSSGSSSGDGAGDGSSGLTTKKPTKTTSTPTTTTPPNTTTPPTTTAPTTTAPPSSCTGLHKVLGCG